MFLGMVMTCIHSGGEIDLFGDDLSSDATAPDIDLFGDFEDLTPVEAQPEPEICAEELRKSIENFYGIFSKQDNEMSASSGAILLYQHLLAAGYQANILVEDQGAKVTASTCSYSMTGPLLERIEYLLDDMVYVQKDWKVSGFTVHSINTIMSGDKLEIGIEFISV